MQSSSSHVSTPSIPPPAPIQATTSAPPTQTPTIVLEESNDEQGLQSDVLDLLLHSTTNPEQPYTSAPIPEVASVAAEIVEQTINDPVEQLRTKQAPITKPFMEEPLRA